MFKITETFSQLNGLQQKDIEFVNVILGRDNQLFLDFNKIYLGTDKNSKKLKLYIEAYMNTLVSKLFANDTKKTSDLLNGIHESNETYLGMSKATKGLPRGKSIGPKLKKEVFNNLQAWKSLLQKNPFIDSFHYGIKEIGPDRISDIVTSICKLGLIEFTQEQCNKHNIPTQRFLVKFFNINTNTWGFGYFELPYYRNEAIIFIPKNHISSYNSLNSNFSLFISFAFENYFKNLPRLKHLIREENNLDSPLLKKEFKKALKKENTSLKNAAQESFTNIENSVIIDILDSIRKRHSLMLDTEIEGIIDLNDLNQDEKLA